MVDFYKFTQMPKIISAREKNLRASALCHPVVTCCSPPSHFFAVLSQLSNHSHILIALGYYYFVGYRTIEYFRSMQECSINPGTQFRTGAFSNTRLFSFYSQSLSFVSKRSMCMFKCVWVYMFIHMCGGQCSTTDAVPRRCLCVLSWALQLDPKLAH